MWTHSIKLLFALFVTTFCDDVVPYNGTDNWFAMDDWLSDNSSIEENDTPNGISSQRIDDDLLKDFFDDILEYDNSAFSNESLDSTNLNETTDISTDDGFAENRTAEGQSLQVSKLESCCFYYKT
jgi:hypothetical protein